jgi:hypothetical protein
LVEPLAPTVEPWSGLFRGYEIFANCILATLGVVLIAAASRSSSGRQQ